jgi:hypothetical protein
MGSILSGLEYLKFTPKTQLCQWGEWEFMSIFKETVYNLVLNYLDGHYGKDSHYKEKAAKADQLFKALQAALPESSKAEAELKTYDYLRTGMEEDLAINLYQRGFQDGARFTTEATAVKLEVPVPEDAYNDRVLKVWHETKGDPELVRLDNEENRVLNQVRTIFGQESFELMMDYEAIISDKLNHCTKHIYKRGLTDGAALKVQVFVEGEWV